MLYRPRRSGRQARAGHAFTRGSATRGRANDLRVLTVLAYIRSQRTPQEILERSLRLRLWIRPPSLRTIRRVLARLEQARRVSRRTRADEFEVWRRGLRVGSRSWVMP